MKKARKLDRITSEEMLELAASGAKVLHIRAVEYARRHGVTLHVRSSFNNSEGTIVYDPSRLPEGAAVEESVIAGVAVDLTEAKITVVGVPDVPGVAAKIFKIVANTNANVDMIVQNVSAASTGRTDISFTLPKSDGETRAHRARELDRTPSASCRCSTTTRSASSRSSAPAMRSATGVSARLFEALYEAGINIEMISTSEIRISVVTRADSVHAAARAVHTAFEPRRRRRCRRARRHRALSATPSSRHPAPSDAAAAAIVEIRRASRGILPRFRERPRLRAQRAGTIERTLPVGDGRPA